MGNSTSSFEKLNELMSKNCYLEKICSNQYPSLNINEKSPHYFIKKTEDDSNCFSIFVCDKNKHKFYIFHFLLGQENEFILFDGGDVSGVYYNSLISEEEKEKYQNFDDLISAIKFKINVKEIKPFDCNTYTNQPEYIRSKCENTLENAEYSIDYNKIAEKYGNILNFAKKHVLQRVCFVVYQTKEHENQPVFYSISIQLLGTIQIKKFVFQNNGTIKFIENDDFEHEHYYPKEQIVYDYYEDYFNKNTLSECKVQNEIDKNSKCSFKFTRMRLLLLICFFILCIGIVLASFQKWKEIKERQFNPFVIFLVFSIIFFGIFIFIFVASFPYYKISSDKNSQLNFKQLTSITTSKNEQQSVAQDYIMLYYI